MLNVTPPTDRLHWTRTGRLDRAVVDSLVAHPADLHPIQIANGTSARLDRLAALADLLASYPQALERHRANTV